VYILLLTCASSRAIHLELVYNMSKDGFLRGFKQFVARRGVPDLIIHKNYEHLVQTVKSCLKKTPGRTHTTFEELQTILCKVEVAINNRPLAYVSEDDLDEPLTSFHFFAWAQIITFLACLASVMK
jgi:hypothetical protein